MSDTCGGWTPAKIKAAALPKPTVAHYQQQEIEPIDYIRAMGADVFMGFCIGNVIKYLSRAPYKGAELEDYRKARQYLDWLIEITEKSK